jgi:hypothetical protein
MKSSRSIWIATAGLLVAVLAACGTSSGAGAPVTAPVTAQSFVVSM